ncbi:MAG: hypothetical protein FJZ01_02245 [Candidatus Sericytochromatia bacterium]|nr:hypothetical protein [Candidatus Tanganyikabacteria bacterium]
MIRIESFAGELLRDYDHNRNGAIDLQADGRGRDERLTKKTKEYEGLIRSRYYQDVLSWSSLFNAADADGDGRATGAELRAYLKAFDWNGDGALDFSQKPRTGKRSFWQKIADFFSMEPTEQDAFYRKHREERVDRIPLTVIQRKAPAMDTEIRYTEPDQPVD